MTYYTVYYERVTGMGRLDVEEWEYEDESGFLLLYDTKPDDKATAIPDHIINSRYMIRIDRNRGDYHDNGTNQL